MTLGAPPLRRLAYSSAYNGRSVHGGRQGRSWREGGSELVRAGQASGPSRVIGCKTVLAHDRRGSGPPLVLLHGIGMRWQWWAPCLDALARRHEVISVDLPGFGGTAPLAADDEPTPVRQAEAVEAFLAELGIARPHVAGISMGGQVSLELARRESVATATAISPGGFSRGRELIWTNATLVGTARLVRLVAPYAD